MTDIVAGIDAWMKERYASSYSLLLYGFCELARRTNTGSEQPIPLTITGTHKREQVALDDRYQLITWIRLPGTISFGEQVDGNDMAFGLDDGHVSTASLRMVVAHRVALGESLIVDIARNIPPLISNPAYRIISVDKPSISIDADHETIYNTELGSGQYEKHRTAWNLYVINFNVQFITC